MCVTKTGRAKTGTHPWRVGDQPVNMDAREVADASNSEQAAQAPASQKNSSSLHPARDTAAEAERSSQLMDFTQRPSAKSSKLMDEVVRVTVEVSEVVVDEGPGASDNAAVTPRRVRTDRVLVLRPLARRRMWAWVGKIALKDGRLVAAQAPFGVWRWVTPPQGERRGREN